MSKEEARRFAAGWGKDDQIEQAIMALPREQRDSIEAIARVARDLGYAITHEELAEAFAEEQKTRRTELENAEISIDDLDQVAGGWRRISLQKRLRPQRLVLGQRPLH